MSKSKSQVLQKLYESNVESHNVKIKVVEKVQCYSLNNTLAPKSSSEEEAF